MEWINILVTAISTLVGLLGGGVGVWIITLYKEKKASDIAANEQALKIYQDLFINRLGEKDNAIQFYRDALLELDKKLDELQHNKQLMENDYLELRLENLKLKVALESNRK